MHFLSSPCTRRTARLIEVSRPCSYSGAPDKDERTDIGTVSFPFRYGKNEMVIEYATGAEAADRWDWRANRRDIRT